MKYKVNLHLGWLNLGVSLSLAIDIRSHTNIIIGLGSHTIELMIKY